MQRLGPPAIRIEPAGIAPEIVLQFCDLLLKAEPRAPLSFIPELQNLGASSQRLRYGLIAGAARCLRERWDAGETGFLDVTLAAGQLHALVRAVRVYDAGDALARRTRPDALFASVPGKSHTLGISLAAETFRDAGWDIDLQIADHHDELVNRVIKTEPAVVGLSLSTRDRLPDLMRLVMALRIAAPAVTIGVTPALYMLEDMIFGLVDLDLIFRDARIALNDLERPIRLRR